jgi:hypothetical protein
MISKKTFCDTLNRMKELQTAEDAINNVFESIGSEFNQFSLDDAMMLTLNVLLDAMNDKEEWIVYYVFDMNYGRNFGNSEDFVPVDNEGNIVPLGTAEELYDYLIGLDNKIIL